MKFQTIRTVVLGLVAVLAAACFVPDSSAQPVNRVSQIGVTDSQGATQVNPEGLRTTYSAVFTGLVPAASATDVVCIAGSATKTIKVQYFEVSGTAGTLVTLPVFLAKRATADSGGTPATGNALPVASKMDSLNAAATATLVSYTANPTINDSSPLLIRAATVTLPVTTAGVVTRPAAWRFGDAGGQAVVLRGAAQQLCLNLSGISVSSGVLAGSIQWVEE